ncbi:cell division protein FtsZ, partial [Pseudoalteromonas ruthenica]
QSAGMFVPSFTQSETAQDTVPSTVSTAQTSNVPAPESQASAKPAEQDKEKGDYFDIPAFLRKQSD